MSIDLGNLLPIFSNNLLPIFLAAGAGYLLSRTLHVNPRGLAQVIFYILSPCLIFNLLVKNQLGNGEVFSIMLIASVFIVIMGALTWLMGKALRLPRSQMAAVLLGSMFMNAGNYGMPVALFAFGETALSYASLFFIADAVMAYSLGVLIASMGKANLKQAITNLFKIPTIYALILGMVFMQTGWQTPTYVQRTIDLLGDASIPAMLVLLGLQFHQADWRGKLKPLTLASGMRLVIAPLLLLLLAPIFGLSGIARQASVLQAGMPTAVLTTTLATEFDSEPSLVAATVFITTLLSPLTLTPLLAYLGA